MTAKEAATQCNDENDTFYDDVWPIECEQDLNQQEEWLKDVSRRNAMVRYSYHNIYIITRKYNNIIGIDDRCMCIYINFSEYLLLVLCV